MINKGGNYYRALEEITSTLNKIKNEREGLQAVLKIITRALNGDAGIIMLLDSTREHLLRVATYGLTEWYLRKGMVSAQNACLSEVLSGKTVVVGNATENPHVKHPELARQAGIASILSAPLIYQEEVLGAVRVYTRSEREFHKKDCAFLETAAKISAMALGNAILRDTIKKETSMESSLEPDLTGRLSSLTSQIRKPSQFAHPSEEEFAKLLDFYRLEWIYEPRSFTLEKDGNRIVEMFTPDFYLPQLDLYVEITTMKQSLATEKNKKIRHLKELHPEINVKLLNKKDYASLLAKYGYGPLSEAKVRGIGKVLITVNRIQKRVMEMAREISIDYADRRPMLVGVLKGVVCFASDLMRNISIPVTMDFMAISYYTNDKSGPIRITKDLERSIKDRDIIIIEDIVDTGMTLHYLMNYLSSRQPASISVCTLLDKRVRRLVEVPLQYVGFEIPDYFVVGYGLDFRGEYRNLPFIATLQHEDKETRQLPPTVPPPPDAALLQV
ncbi:MAG: hypoxanthine phosphoribosyltransferase [Dehalococcoidia bacterium]|nr:hypoxanthine phosphoribosyltransferase [Dehalococcoidia bacterium]MDZ4247602.1 hypoxanthine phosphoribosyltransferase [Dehalococcoidia bacterium]